jgi:hypothetical protein
LTVRLSRLVFLDKQTFSEPGRFSTRNLPSWPLSEVLMLG